VEVDCRRYPRRRVDGYVVNRQRNGVDWSRAVDYAPYVRSFEKM
jgi:hypothetical protein